VQLVLSLTLVMSRWIKSYLNQCSSDIRPTPSLRSRGLHIRRTMFHRPHALAISITFRYRVASCTSSTYPYFLSARVKTPEIREPCYQKDSHGH